MRTCMLVFYDWSFCLLLFGNAMRDDPARTQLHPAPALTRGNRYNSDNTDKMGGPKLGFSVDELCPKS